jgi:hypothetical protein
MQTPFPWTSHNSSLALTCNEAAKAVTGGSHSTLFGARSRGSTARQLHWQPCLPESYACTNSPALRSNLLNPLAAALDQEEQHNHKKYACNYPDKCRIHHFETSLPR